MALGPLLALRRWIRHTGWLSWVLIPVFSDSTEPPKQQLLGVSAVELRYRLAWPEVCVVALACAETSCAVDPWLCVVV